MENSIKKEFTWNYYIYYVINLTYGHVVFETGDLSIAKTKLLECKQTRKNERFAIQQQHFISKII